MGGITIIIMGTLDYEQATVPKSSLSRSWYVGIAERSMGEHDKESRVLYRFDRV